MIAPVQQFLGLLDAESPAQVSFLFYAGYRRRGGKATRSISVPEVAHSGEHHGQSRAISGLDDFLIFH